MIGLCENLDLQVYNIPLHKRISDVWESAWNSREILLEDGASPFPDVSFPKHLGCIW